MAEDLPMEVTVQEVKASLGDDGFVLIDCREPEEWEVARIDGAQLLPMSQWQEKAETLSQFSGDAVVVHCHHGVRSLRVTNWLRQNGFPQAQSMAGGIQAWSEEIDPEVPTY